MLVRRKTNIMKKVKLILIAMLSVLTLNSFAQSILASVTPAIGSICNGSTVFTGTQPGSDFIWTEQGSTSSFLSGPSTYNICPGVYDVEAYMGGIMYYDTVITIPLQSIAAVVTPATSDTLCNGSTIFNGAPVSAIFIWMQQFTTPISTTTPDSTVYNLCPGIYNVEVWNNMSDTMYYSTVITILSPSTHLGIDELTNESKIVGVFDLIGKESELVTNKPLIFVYSNGTRKRKYITE